MLGERQTVAADRNATGPAARSGEASRRSGCVSDHQVEWRAVTEDMGNNRVVDGRVGGPEASVGECVRGVTSSSDRRE